MLSPGRVGKAVLKVVLGSLIATDAHGTSLGASGRCVGKQNSDPRAGYVFKSNSEKIAPV